VSNVERNGLEPLVSLRNVSVSYWLNKSAIRRNSYWPLKDVSFDLYQGDSLGIVGRNGVGKSTLLRLLAGIMKPDYGSIKTVAGLRVSLLSLQLGFAGHLSGRENAILGGMFLGMTLREVRAKLDAIADFAELGEFFDRPISTYSSGMVARLGFATAFQVDPDVLLVDEVTGVGDAEFQRKSMAVMKERIRSHETTIVFVSHHAQTVKDLCNRAVWIEEGIVRAEGATEDVLALYAAGLAPPK